MPIAELGIGGAALLGGAISGGSSILGGIMGANATEDAAQLQYQGQQQALATQQGMFNTALDVVKPYATQGLGAYNALSRLYGIPYSNEVGTSPGGQRVINNAMSNFTNTPDYKFAFDQGRAALDASAAARGNLLSGAPQVAAATEFGQGLASQQFTNYVSRLMGLAQIGSGAAGTVMGGSNAAAQGIAGTQSAMGATQAAGTIGSTQSIVSGLTGGANSVASSLVLSQLPAILGKQTPPVTNPGVSPNSSYQPTYSPVATPLSQIGAVPTNPYTGLGIGGV